ncbi:rRNA maturation RNase YbeY [Gracilimonas sp. Q87]|uniref:rRNA maturation RNase YbeY n=1 Tax=Gracilimonas sp. Q87 TaxID=3384766 RepID=UPI003984163A
MSEPTLQSFNESSVNVPLDQPTAQKILSLIEVHEKVVYSFVELVYVDEEEIIRINNEHLDRDYVTDIISFRYDEESDGDQEIEGTLFCCAPRIKEQAQEFGESAEREFERILIHGLLHLIGYNDQTEEEKRSMTELEDKYLALSEDNK